MSGRLLRRAAELPDALVARGALPDPLLRFAIRRLLGARLRRERPRAEEARTAAVDRLADELGRSPVATHTTDANRQHYEVPTAFFERVLGPRLKYSSCLWPSGVETLADAEEAMLRLTASRARLEEGQAVLELGCGWGSLTLWMLERFTDLSVTAVTSSRTQRDFVFERARELGAGDRLEVLVTDVRNLGSERLRDRFDRVVSVEMFEHLRNWPAMLERIAAWLRPGGRAFLHVFCHREIGYPFEDAGASDWMARHFFSGGLMPAAGLIDRFRDHLEVEDRWLVGGEHYARTAEAWLRNQDADREAILPILEATYGAADRDRWWHYWRLFFLACAELFAYRGGDEWMVAHYRLRRAARSRG
jgi:cyclopropane-fatty-acyl-phospholipid synthase